MLVKAGRRDERGSALVSVLVIMLVLTLFALTLAAIVTNTGSTAAGGRSTSQARAAADAGVASALAAFKKAEVCTGTIASTTAPVYSATCAVATNTVTFTSTGSAGGRQVSVQAVYGFTTAQSYEAKVGQLTFFTETTTYAPNKVTSSTTDRAKLIVAKGDFRCNSPMAANVVVEEDFSSDSACAVSGWVKVKGDATMNAGSSIGGSLTAGKNVILNPVSTVGGSLTAGGTVVIGSNCSVGADLTSVGTASLRSGGVVGGDLTSGGNASLDSSSSVVGDLATGGYADLGSGTSVGGNVTSTSYSDIEGIVKGNVEAGGYVTTWSNSSVEGRVTAAGTDRTWIRGTVGKDVKAIGPVTTYYNSNVTGDVIASGTLTTEVYSRVGGDLAVHGAALISDDGRVGGNATAAGTGMTSVRGKVTGSLKAAGRVYIYDGGSVSGDVTAGTGATTVRGEVGGSLKVAGTVILNYNRTVGADLSSSATGTNYIYGFATGNVSVGGHVNLPSGGGVGGNLTLPSSRSLTPSDAATRVAGTVTREAGPMDPAAPSAPSLTLSPPVVTVTAPPDPSVPTWQDYGYASADWPGYTVQQLDMKSSWCTTRSWATYLETFATPTVLDATACKDGLHQHPDRATPVTINANVVVVSSEIDLQFITFQAASGTSPSLWFIVPSFQQKPRKYPGGGAESGVIDLNSTTVGVPTLLYTPTRINIRSSTFTGSMYSGSIALDSGPPGDIKAAPVEFPIALFESTQPTTPGGTFSVTRISQREIG